MFTLKDVAKLKTGDKIQADHPIKWSNEALVVSNNKKSKTIRYTYTTQNCPVYEDTYKDFEEDFNDCHVIVTIEGFEV